MIKSLCQVSVILLVVGAYCALSGGAHAAEPSDVPVSWSGVEVVTNDFAAVDRIRGAVGLSAGSVLAPSDPKLRVACDAVRNKVPSSSVECSHVIRPSKTGHPEAFLVVEVDVPQRAPLRCLPGARQDPRLVAMSQRWLQAIGKPESAASSGRVNERDYLDYADVELSALAATLHSVTRGRTLEVEAGAVSCNPLERMHSLHLMNFAGDPQRFVTMAAVHVNDDHPGAADAAVGFLTMFAEFIYAQDVQHVAREACKGVAGDFAARRSALDLLIGLQDTGSVSFAQLPPECQQQIRGIARTSRVLPAKNYLDSAGEKTPS